MDKAIKEKWVAALRSGEYEQHKHSICDSHQRAFCCLGVGAAIAGAKVSDFDVRFFTANAANLLGLNEQTRDELADMNDWRGMSFDDIADHIEANIPGE